MYSGYGTCTVIPTCFMLWGLGGLCVYYLEPCMPILFFFLGCGAFIYGVVLVTVMTITWSGACVRLNLFTET